MMAQPALEHDGGVQCNLAYERGRIVPTISASVSWLIFVVTGSGRPSLPKLARRRSVRARRFSLELNRWSTRFSSTRLLRVSRYVVNNAPNSGAFWRTRIISALAIRITVLPVIAKAVARR